MSRVPSGLSVFHGAPKPLSSAAGQRDWPSCQSSRQPVRARQRLELQRLRRAAGNVERRGHAAPSWPQCPVDPARQGDRFGAARATGKDDAGRAVPDGAPRIDQLKMAVAPLRQAGGKPASRRKEGQGKRAAQQDAEHSPAPTARGGGGGGCLGCHGAAGSACRQAHDHRAVPTHAGGGGIGALGRGRGGKVGRLRHLAYVSDELLAARRVRCRAPARTIARAHPRAWRAARP